MATASVDIEAAREPGSGLSSVVLRRSSDAALVRRASRGDRQAFAVIFERYSDPLYRYCVSILGNPEDAADALQGAMESALKAMKASGGSPRQLKPWLYRIAHNESISMIRRRRPEVALENLELPGHGTTEERVALRARVEALFSDLRDLPDAQRGALLMRELSGLGYEEIATALSVSPAAAKQAVYEARVALHEVEEGRRMLCADARTAISDGDGRRLRGRKVRAHLKSCGDCAAFRDVMRARQADLAAIPPLGAAAGAGLLASILGGGGSGGTGGAGAIFGGGLGSVVTAKGVAAIATGAIIAGAAGVEISRSNPDRGDGAGRDAAGHVGGPRENAGHGRGRSEAALKGKNSGRRNAEKRGREPARRNGAQGEGPGTASGSAAPVAPKGGGASSNGTPANEAHPAEAGLAVAEQHRPDNPGAQGAGNAAGGIETAGNALEGASEGAANASPPAPAEKSGSAAPLKDVIGSVAGSIDPGRTAGRAGGS